MLLSKRRDSEIGPFPPAQQRRATSAPSRSVIDPCLTITGDVQGEGELQIDGRICGDIRCTQLIVGKAGTVEGNITADEIVVRGKVNGIIRGNRVILQEGADVHSEIFHKRLTIEEGALMEGAIRMRENPTQELLSPPAQTWSAPTPPPARSIQSEATPPPTPRAEPATAATAAAPANEDGKIDIPQPDIEHAVAQALGRLRAASRLVPDVPERPRGPTMPSMYRYRPRVAGQDELGPIERLMQVRDTDPAHFRRERLDEGLEELQAPMRGKE
jgi:cytoskeletal protein CcmA (bactofilin family)